MMTNMNKPIPGFARESELEGLTVAGVQWLQFLRCRYRPLSRHLTTEEHQVLTPYFSTSLIDTVRVFEIEDFAKLDLPDSMRAFMEQQNEWPIPLFDIRGFTAIDTILVARLKLTADVSLIDTLFQEMIHVAQFDCLGVEDFIQRYVQQWINGQYRNENIAMEITADTLQQRFRAGHLGDVTQYVQPMKLPNRLSTSTIPSVSITRAYTPRVVENLGINCSTSGCYKVYGIHLQDQTLNPILVTDGVLALPTLWQSVSDQDTGFIIIHQAADGCYLLGYRWSGENMLEQRVLGKSNAADPVWKELDNPYISACVWELEIIYFERSSWISTVMNQVGVVNTQLYLETQFPVLESK